MFVNREHVGSVKRHLEVAELWRNASDANLRAKEANDPLERRRCYAEKGEFISKLIEMEAAEIQMDGHEMSVVDPVTGWRFHIRWEQLSPKVLELIKNEICVC